MSSIQKPDRLDDACIRQYFFELEERHFFCSIDVSNKVVLDLGCGSCRLIHSLRDIPCTFIGLDINAGSVTQAAARVEAVHVEAVHNEREFVVGDGSNLPLKSSSVDLVVALGTFEHIKDMTPFLDEIWRVLRPQGQLVLTCWASHIWSHFPVVGLDSQAAVHALPDIKSRLNSSGLQVVHWHGVFFLPRRVFWWLYRILPRLCRRPYVASAIVLEAWLGRLPMINRLGWEYQIYAERW